MNADNFLLCAFTGLSYFCFGLLPTAIPGLFFPKEELIAQ